MRENKIKNGSMVAAQEADSLKIRQTGKPLPRCNR
jgi:hypothetical protein